MVVRFLRVITPVLCLTGAVMPLGGGVATARGASSTSPDEPLAPVVRMVEIDGRFVRVGITITTTIPGIPPPTGTGVTTDVRATISISDGALLPEGLTAVRVRLQRLTGRRAPFFARLSEVPTTAMGFELDQNDYTADISSRVGNARRFRATIRLEIGDRVIPVPLGIVRIGTRALP